MACVLQKHLLQPLSHFIECTCILVWKLKYLYCTTLILKSVFFTNGSAHLIPFLLTEFLKLMNFIFSQFLVHSKIEWKVQSSPIFLLLSPHSLLYQQAPLMPCQSAASLQLMSW
jgi:hypothetical protein